MTVPLTRGREGNNVYRPLASRFQYILNYKLLMPEQNPIEQQLSPEPTMTSTGAARARCRLFASPRLWWDSLQLCWVVAFAPQFFAWGL